MSQRYHQESKKTAPRMREDFCESFLCCLTSRVYKRLLTAPTVKDSPIFKVRKGFNRYFSKEDTQVANKQMQKC